MLIAFASAGAILGDNIGYWLGREVGFRVLLRYGSNIGLTEGRIKLGEYLFQMSWPRFVIFNAAGGILWAACYGLAAFYFGKSIEAFTRPVGLALLVAGGVLLLLLLWFIRRHEAELTAKAERAFPGPVKSRKQLRRSAA